ncbi:hypothetical protein DFP72DRAFT_894548 [Ephemerocybe angulata]|uniref:Uncharacterized protein n=1 Tax=Ephemerocybe angulata TaxID=980116 RepID=A0A8H6M8J0_9AGAR|nr:hypothetical protein DFP72DRAFT_894548 [Tulosesus angulatus]
MPIHGSKQNTGGQKIPILASFGARSVENRGIAQRKVPTICMPQGTRFRPTSDAIGPMPYAHSVAPGCRLPKPKQVTTTNTTRDRASFEGERRRVTSRWPIAAALDDRKKGRLVISQLRLEIPRSHPHRAQRWWYPQCSGNTTPDGRGREGARL